MSTVAAGKTDTHLHAGNGERRVLIPHDVALPPSFAALRVLQMKELGGETMGTSWSAKVAVPTSFDVAPLARGIEDVLARIIDEMSPWEPGSHLSRFNAAPAGSSHRLPPGFFKVLSAALHWAKMSNGAFDPTVGAAVGCVGLRPRRSEIHAYLIRPRSSPHALTKVGAASRSTGRIARPCSREASRSIFARLPRATRWMR